MISLTDQNFEQIVKENNKPVLVDFFAEWCPPCKMLSPILEKLDKEYKEKIIFAKINVDVSPQTAQKFSIDSIPVVILFKKGELVGTFVGLSSEEEIKTWLEDSLK